MSRPDEVWVADVTYIKLRREFVYLAIIMDVFTRCIWGWHLGRGLDRELALTASQRPLATGHPQYITPTREYNMRLPPTCSCCNRLMCKLARLQ